MSVRVEAQYDGACSFDHNWRAQSLASIEVQSAATVSIVGESVSSPTGARDEQVVSSTILIANSRRGARYADPID